MCPPFAVAEEIGALDAELVEERHRVLRRLLEGEGTIDVGRPSVSLPVVGDHPTPLGQRRKDVAEGRLECRATSVEKDERGSLVANGPVDLVVHLQAVDGRVAFLDCAAGSQRSRQDHGRHHSSALQRVG